MEQNPILTQREQLDKLLALMERVLIENEAFMKQIILEIRQSENKEEEIHG